jgi:two-component system, response regulator
VNQKVILLVEDNPDDEILTRRAIAQNRIANEVVVAPDGEDALDYLFGKGKYDGRDVSDQPSLVLLDIKLPKIDGFEVLRQIRQDPRTKCLPVVMLTTSREDRDVLKGYEGGVNSYVRKPVDFEEFVGAVRQVGVYWLLLNVSP